jgi:energy-coupling factor transporter ATP-binding protein EcfA2
MIEFEDVSVRYDSAATWSIRSANFEISEGELALLVGGTGSGKSTLISCVNGLVPHFTGGTLAGRVRVAGRDTRDHPPRELADVVGMVRQDPQSGFVTDIVEDELAYTMESLGIPPAVMRRRVEETLDLLGLASLRTRTLRTLSGGERQRVAIGAVLTAQPRVLVLDEPTSALDPQAAEDVLAAIQRLVHDLGLTVLMSEHRLERVIQYADQVLVMQHNEVRQYLNPAEAMLASPVTPPVVDLGARLRLSPIPLSVRDARRAARPHRDFLMSQTQDSAAVPVRPHRPTAPAQGPIACLRKAQLAHGHHVVLRELSTGFSPGTITALMGRNGAGKSSLLQLLVGSVRPGSGQATVSGLDPAKLSGADLLREVAYVPQEPDDLLWAETVQQECTAADRDANKPSGTTALLLDDLLPDMDVTTHPRDLSIGSRLMLVLAIMLAGDAKLLLLDEPTRGLDYAAKDRLSAVIRSHAARGTAVVVATHDVEFVAGLCDRLLILADGDLVTDDVVQAALMDSAMFAPQVAKIMAPLPYLTVADLPLDFSPLPETDSAAELDPTDFFSADSHTWVGPDD